MAKLTKNRKQLLVLTIQNHLQQAKRLKWLKKAATAKFDESVDVAINPGVDPRKSDQNDPWFNCIAQWYW